MLNSLSVFLGLYTYNTLIVIHLDLGRNIPDELQQPDMIMQNSGGSEDFQTLSYLRQVLSEVSPQCHLNAYIHRYDLPISLVEKAILTRLT